MKERSSIVLHPPRALCLIALAISLSLVPGGSGAGEAQTDRLRESHPEVCKLLTHYGDLSMRIILVGQTMPPGNFKKAVSDCQAIREKLLTMTQVLGDKRIDALAHEMLDRISPSKLRFGAALLLGDLNDKSAVQPLMAALRFGLPGGLRMAVGSALAKTDDATIVPKLVAMCESDDRATSEAGFGGLENLIGVPQIPHLAAHLNHPDKRVRFSIVDVLGSIDDPAIVPPLIQALADENEGVVMFAVMGLGSHGDARALPFLRERLKLGGDFRLQRKIREAFASIQERVQADAEN
jgi:HEAT repeat protein